MKGIYGIMVEDCIKLDLSVMENCSKSFSDSSNKILDIAQKLASVSSSMETAWEDPMQISFEASLEEMLSDFEKVYGCLCAMSSFTSYVVELYQLTDQTVKKLL